MPAHPDPTFHASAKLAMQAPPEKLAYTVMLSPDFSQPDALAIVDLDPGSKSLGKIVHTVIMPNKGDEFHHFGWNACSSALSPLAGHAFLERRYLIIPGIRSSRIYVIDTKPDPTKAKIHKIIEPEEVLAKTGYSRPHTIHCGPEGIYVSTLGGGGPDGTNGPPGIFIMDCETFEVIGRYELDRGMQDKHYDFWWNLPRDYMVSSEWGLPPQFENGVVPADLLSNKYGHRLHFWNLRVMGRTDLERHLMIGAEVDGLRVPAFRGAVRGCRDARGADVLGLSRPIRGPVRRGHRRHLFAEPGSREAARRGRAGPSHSARSEPAHVLFLRRYSSVSSSASSSTGSSEIR